MSTILDALKKVEQERTSDTAADQQRQLEALQPTAEVRQKRFIKGIVGGSLALAVLILAAITYYMFSADPQPTASQAKRSTAKQPKAAATPSKKIPPTAVADPQKPRPDRSSQPSFSRPIRKRQSRTPDTPSADRSSPTPRATFNRPNQPPTNNQANNPVGRTASPTPRPEPRTNSAPAAPPAHQAPQQRPQADSAPAAPPVPPAPAQDQQAVAPQQKAASHSHIERLTDGSLDVQAIAWSPIAEESMAVINNKIVREGNSVDDYTLVAIGQDDVVVRKAGREWRVIIGRN